MDLNGKIINFLGDSITEGVGTSSENCRFTNILLNKFHLCQVRNYGIGGTRIAPQHSPSEDPLWDNDFCGRYQEMNNNANVVVVFGGTNDFGHGDAPIGDALDSIPTSFAGACDYLFRGLKQKYPSSIIVVITPTHRADENGGAGDSRSAANKPLSIYVEMIRKKAEQHKLFFLDLFDYQANPSARKLTMNMLPDGLHPNDEGHLILAELISDFLRLI